MSSSSGKKQVEHRRAGARPKQEKATKSDTAEFIKQADERRPLAALHSLRDRAALKGYKLKVYKEKAGWEYTIEGVRGQFVRFPWGGCNDFDLLMVQLEMEVDRLPR